MKSFQMSKLFARERLNSGGQCFWSLQDVSHLVPSFLDTLLILKLNRGILPKNQKAMNGLSSHMLHKDILVVVKTRVHLSLTETDGNISIVLREIKPLGIIICLDRGFFESRYQSRYR